MKKLFLLLTVFAISTVVHAQSTFPNKPITLVVPYPVGGSNDVFARLIAKNLGEALKVSVVVDNRPGASGSTGTIQVSKSAPDGYTLLAVSSSMTTNVAIQTKSSFDPVTGLTAIAMLAKGPFIVAVNNDFPAKNPAELIALLKANPGKFNYASSGTGSSNQFATELLKAMSGTFAVHIPYRGMGPATTDLIGGQTQILLASGPSLLPQVRNGRIRAIGITSLNPSPIAPELIPVSTVIPGYEFELWWGILGPAGMPTDIVNLLNREINKILASPEIKATLLREGAEASPESPAQFANRLSGDIARWRSVAKRQNITAE
ncbi:tripartite tricarboxylate transporter substrate binding protein [Polynucleobacter sp. UK-Mo-2m-Kol15]|uniref:tripartite tricarboxylate transporter substrate binding protein n=1 Tax=Polynucleobacter sp. UK-Mo-2m-Kol15 TaxID=2576916 RepID=UPI001C0CF244|nr:tripartite tricarboxylate transporter substrate binding protein [Polynucleobacter sp. UK-Mo-2m-Kol15]MBU3574863.1 tripartite tricarboxylate transporter substrate binding protein [Polynucleobacter sp. UK-Mo-2m-Kol15]